MRTDKKGNAVIVTLDEKFDTDYARGFKEFVEKSVSENINNIVVDFSECSFINSNAIGSLILIAKNLRKTGGELKVCSLNEAVLNLFKMTRLDKLIEIFSSRDDALSNF